MYQETENKGIDEHQATSAHYLHSLFFSAPIVYAARKKDPTGDQEGMSMCKRAGQEIYRSSTARPAAAIMPPAAVGRAAAPDDDEVAADLAADAALDAALEALEASDEAVAPRPLAAELAVDATELKDPAEPERRDAAELALEAIEDPVLAAPAPPPEIVVEPTVVVKVDDPLVTIETMAEVVTAEEPPAAALPEVGEPVAVTVAVLEGVVTTVVSVVTETAVEPAVPEPAVARAEEQ